MTHPPTHRFQQLIQKLAKQTIHPPTHLTYLPCIDSTTSLPVPPPRSVGTRSETRGKNEEGPANSLL